MGKDKKRKKDATISVPKKEIAGKDFIKKLMEKYKKKE